MSSDATVQRPGAVKTGVMATLILAWEGFADLTVSFALVASAVVVRPAVLFVVTLMLYAAIALTFCTWIDNNWDAWYSKAGPRIQAKVDKWRGGGSMSRVVGWITDGSALSYGVAAALASPVIVVTTARVVGGRPVGRGRVVWSCVAYAMAMAVVVSVLGAAVAAGTRAL